MRGFQGKGSGGKSTHQASYQQLQIWYPWKSDIWEAQGCHRELITPFIVTAVRVEKELQLGASIKRHFLQDWKETTKIIEDSKQ